MTPPPQILVVSCGSWYVRNTAKAFDNRGALAGLWISDSNSTAVSSGKYRRCWPFHLAMKPIYHLATQIWRERAFYAMFPFWRNWPKRQQWPHVDAVHAIMGYATEPFDVADKIGALKIVDCPNSHPTTYFGNWQRECDLWCPGENVPIPRWMFARMNRELDRADLILCPSLFVRDTMVANGLPAEKCFVNPFGVDLSIFKKREDPPARPRFIFVGTICVRKGSQYLFRALEIVKKTLPDAELICVADIKIDFRKELPKWKGSFTYVPGLSHKELAALLTSCSAFVLPSLEDGFARVLSEAMGAGLPIIASHESGATTLVSDGVEGFIIHPRDIQQIADAMIRLGSDAALNRLMGDAAYQKGAIRNSWQDYGDRLIAGYSARLQQKRR